LPFDALFVPDELLELGTDERWMETLIEVERALARVTHPDEPEIGGDFRVDFAELVADARRVGNPVEPLVRRLRERYPYAHDGATSQDILDTAAALVARDGTSLVRAQLDAVADACARLADEHRATVMAGRTLLQQATPTTFGLKAAGWLVAVLDVRDLPPLPVQLGGATGTLAAFGSRGLEVRRRLAEELGLGEPTLTWHANRVPVARLGAALSVAAGACAKIALDIELLAQTEVAEVREAEGGGSSTMPHKRNPVRSTLARACAVGAQAAAGVLAAGVAEHEHERAAGAWHAEWNALADALMLTGATAWWVREALEGLEVDADRMRANIDPATLGEAERFGGADRPDDYLGSASELVDRALERWRSVNEPRPGRGSSTK
jgi:3-carboxy-cis,cis-muconate cycloisomerase